MNAGKLRHRITLQQLIKADDGMGGVTEAWQDIATIWAAVEPLETSREQERYQAQQVQSTLAYKITIRYMPGVKPQMRLMYNNRALQIKSITDKEERHEKLEMLCSEVISA